MGYKSISNLFEIKDSFYNYMNDDSENIDDMIRDENLKIKNKKSKCIAFKDNFLVGEFVCDDSEFRVLYYYDADPMEFVDLVEDFSKDLHKDDVSFSISVFEKPLLTKMLQTKLDRHKRYSMTLNLNDSIIKSKNFDQQYDSMLFDKSIDDKYQQLVLDSYADTIDSLIYPQLLTPTTRKSSHEEDMLSPQLFHDGTLIGSVRVSLGDKCIWLSNISVDPKYHNRGIGRSLIEEVKRLANANQHSKIVLTVTEANTNAYTLYQNMGFIVRDEFFVFRMEIKK